MSSAPRVSVLMPVYNGGAYLANAIKSVLAQTFADFELIVVDDASTDASREVVKSVDDKRVRLIPNAANLGLPAALNIGLAAAAGEYVARMDQDDLCLPTRLERQVAHLDRHAEIGILGTGVQLIDSAGAVGAELFFPASDALIRWKLPLYSPFAHPTVMMRRAVVAALGGYRVSAVHCEDYDLWWRASATTRLANLDQVLLQLRKHDASMTQRFASSHEKTAIEICGSALHATLGETFAPDLIAAVMGRAPTIEAHVPGAVRLLFQYARHCIAAGGLTPEEESSLREDLADGICRWLDDPEPRLGTRARLRRIWRHTRLACTDALLPSERRLVRGIAARRSVDIADGAARRVARRNGLRLWNALVSAYRKLVPWSARVHFTRIYERNTFGAAESHSGEGSTMDQTATIRREIPALLRELGAKSLLDAPCGDFNWMRHVDLGVERYTGVDIVIDLIAADQRKYGAAGREFLCRDLIRDRLPAADVVLCRDCLVHLDFRDAQRMLRNFKRSGARYLLTTTFTARESNQDLVEDMIWRTLNLERAPFNLPAPLRLINENCTEANGAFADKCLGLWRLEDVA